MNSMVTTKKGEILIYRKSLNYKLLAVGFANLFIEGICAYKFMKGASNVTTQAITFFSLYTICIGAIFFQQLSFYKKRTKPILIVSEKGLWYEGSLFRKNIFWAWNDIKNIVWEDSSEERDYAVDSFIVYSYSRFTLRIPFWFLNASPNKIWEKIEFYMSEKKINL